MIYSRGEQITMCKSVKIFYKKDSNAQINEARTGRGGHELLRQGFCPDIVRKNFCTAWQPAQLGTGMVSQKPLCKNDRPKSSRETGWSLCLGVRKEEVMSYFTSPF